MVFIIKLLNKLKKFLNPCEISINRTNKTKLPPKFDKILGCYRLPPLKEISSPRLERLERKKGLGYLGGYHP
jgi:hypothetical protein